MFEEKWCYKWWNDEKVKEHSLFIRDDREGSEYLTGFLNGTKKKRGINEKVGTWALGIEVHTIGFEAPSFELFTYILYTFP